MGNGAADVAVVARLRRRLAARPVWRVVVALCVGALGGTVVWFGTASVASAATSGYVPPATSGTAITGTFPDFAGQLPSGVLANNYFSFNASFSPGVCYADYYEAMAPDGTTAGGTVTFGCQGFAPSGRLLSNAILQPFDNGNRAFGTGMISMQGFIFAGAGPAYYPASCGNGAVDPLGGGGGINGDITTCGSADSCTSSTCVQAPYTVNNQSGVIDQECFLISIYNGPVISGAYAWQFRGYCGLYTTTQLPVIPGKDCGTSTSYAGVSVFIGVSRYLLPVVGSSCLTASNYETVPGVPPYYYSGGQASSYGLACQLNYISGIYDQSVAAGQVVDYTIGFSGGASAVAIDPGDESHTVYLPGAPQQPSFEVGADYAQVPVGGEPAQVSVAPVSAVAQFDPTFFCLYQGTWYPWGDAASSPSPPANTSAPTPGAFSLSSCLASSGMSLTDPVSWVTGMARDSVCVVQWLVVPSPAVTAQLSSSFTAVESQEPFSTVSLVVSSVGSVFTSMEGDVSGACTSPLAGLSVLGFPVASNGIVGFCHGSGAVTDAFTGGSGGTSAPMVAGAGATSLGLMRGILTGLICLLLAVAVLEWIKNGFAAASPH